VNIVGRHDVGRSRSPVKTGDDGLLDLESIHQSDDVESNYRLLAIAEGFTGKKARRAVAAQRRNNHPVASRRQQGGDIDIAVNIVGPAVQKNDRLTIGGASPRARQYGFSRSKTLVPLSRNATLLTKTTVFA
jgi:hypothetical protein